MVKIRGTIKVLEDVTNRYGLRTLFLDFTNTTLISKIGVSQDIFIQIYVNEKKDKINMALVVAGERVYGIDKEGGFLHEHPFENPALHIDATQIEIEDFVVKSLEYLKKINIL